MDIKEMSINVIKDGRGLRAMPRQTLYNIVKEVIKPEDKPKGFSKILKDDLVKLCQEVMIKDHYIIPFTKTIFKYGKNEKCCKANCGCRKRILIDVGELYTTDESIALLVNVLRADYEKVHFDINLSNPTEVREKFKTAWNVIKQFTPDEIEEQEKDIKINWYNHMLVFFIAREYLFHREVPIIPMEEYNQELSSDFYDILSYM